MAKEKPNKVQFYQKKSLSQRGPMKLGIGSQDKGISASLGPLGSQKTSSKSDWKASEKGKFY